MAPVGNEESLDKLPATFPLALHESRHSEPPDRHSEEQHLVVVLAFDQALSQRLLVTQFPTPQAVVVGSHASQVLDPVLDFKQVLLEEPSVTNASQVRLLISPIAHLSPVPQAHY